VFAWIALALLSSSALLASCTEVDRTRSRLLAQMPVGIAMEQVEEFCARKRLKCNRSDHAGFLNQATTQVIGRKSIWGVVHESRPLPFMVSSLTAYWGFDENGKLIDVWVWKTIDAP
jgi:hypothetical protein